MTTFKDFLHEDVTLSRAISTDMKNVMDFVYDTQIGWIGGWKGLRDQSKEFALLPPNHSNDSNDGLGDYDIYPTNNGEVLARLGRGSYGGSPSTASVFKLDLQKGTIAFLDDYTGSDKPKFGKGIKFRFLTISKKGIKQLYKK